MEIECHGCYYTLCSFVCLTEDLSEILQFLWRHGCLRRSYYCEKCGRKCAIGDKDLFFRCNRNILDTPVTQHLPLQSSTQQIASSQQTPLQIQTNGNRQILCHEINQISHHQFYNSVKSELSAPNTAVSVETTNPKNLVLINQSDKLQYLGLLNNGETIQSDSVNVPALSGPVLNYNEVHQNTVVLTTTDSSRNHLIHGGNEYNLSIKREDQTGSIFPLLEAQPALKKSAESKFSEFGNEEPAPKLLKKSNKSERAKSGKKRCNFKVSMKKGTFFERSKLPIDTVCKFVVFWCCMKHPTQEFLRNELSLATRTVVDWSTACREICIHWAKSVSEKIGGDGVIVLVDEVKIQESKQNDNGNWFSFWGMEKDKERGKIFIVPVPACDSSSLLTVINEWILPGSVIISNCWKTYDCLKQQEYIQQTVVQSKTFIHPQNNASSQQFEGNEKNQPEMILTLRNSFES